jgi:mono/diheme cytochrome c family protein
MDTRKHAAVFSVLSALALAPSIARAQATDPAVAQLWEAKCSKCHGLDGKAHTKTGARYKIDDFTSAKWQKEMDDAEIRKTIQNGVKSKKGKVQMPAFKGKLGEDQVAALIAYVRSFGK